MCALILLDCRIVIKSGMKFIKEIPILNSRACHHPVKRANLSCAYTPSYRDAVGLSTLLRQLVTIPHASPMVLN